MNVDWRSLGWGMVIVGTILIGVSVAVNSVLAFALSLGIALGGVASLLYASNASSRD